MAAEDSYSPRGTRVYVGGLNDIVKKEDLEVEFEKFGKLNNVWVAFNPPGFAFIEFANCSDAETACDNLNGTEIMGCKMKVEISRGQSRGSTGGGRGGGFRGRSNGRGFFPRGGSRASYSSDRGGFRRGRGTRDSFRGRRGRYDDYGSSSGGGGGGGYGSSRGGGGYGGSRGYGQSSSRDNYEGNAYYSGRDSSSRDRCRSPVGRGSSRDYGRSEDTFGYGRSGDDN